jgi:flagellar biosynthetic protein FliQ
MELEFQDAVMIGRDLMMTSLLLVAPIVIVSLVVGLFISIAQTVTSIQEQTLTFAPRIVAVVGTIIVLTPWYLKTLTNYTSGMFELIGESF